MDSYVERVIDLTDHDTNQIYNFTVEEARALLLNRSAADVYAIQGSFALIARSGKTVRMARSLDRPMRYFLAKRAAKGRRLSSPTGLMSIYNWLKEEGLAEQFHPSYTRMVPAHHIVEHSINRLSGSGPGLHALLYTRIEIVAGRSGRDRRASTSPLWPKRFRNGCGSCPRRSRRVFVFPAASTAEAFFSPRTM